MSRGFGTLSRAMLLSFVRDRTALFFTIFFPLMFLVIFGGLFNSSSSSRSKVLEVGQVAVLDQLPGDARAQLDKVLNITRKDDEAAALESVRKGDYAAAISEQGNTVVVRYSAADQVQSATVQG